MPLSLILSLAGYIACAGPIVVSHPFTWTFISTESDGTMGSPAMPWTGVRSLFVGVGGYSPGGGGYDRFEFSFSGNLEVVDLIPLNGALNEGTITSPSLVLPECGQSYPPVIAEIVVLDSSGNGGSLCFTDSAISDRNCAHYCNDDFPVDFWLANFYTGFASDGSIPCDGVAASNGCVAPVSLRAATWGQVKATYR